MRLLLDTHIVLWAATGDERLGKTVLSALADPDNERIVSHASLWEIAIKRSVGKLIVSEADIDQALADMATDELPIARRHILATAALPPHHRDPFDRLLIVQAQCEGLTLVTADRQFKAYAIPILPA